ncbi:oxalate decarboxylase, partial [Truncatella angustata]
VVERDAGFSSGQPIDGKGKGAPILGGTNKQIDLQNPDNLGQQSTDNGIVPNLKWSFSDSKTRILNGGWVREQVVTDLPSSHDLSAAQQHLTKGSIRELHWHKVAEWGYVYAGSVLVSAVDENGQYQVSKLEIGDVWYFPKGEAHTIQGLEDENEFLLVFDETNFDAVGTTFNIDDWLAHTPKSIIAKSLGVDESVLGSLPSTNPYILNATIGDLNVTGPYGELSGNNSYVYFAKDHEDENIPGGGGSIRIIDTKTFPIAKTIAAAVVTLQPGAIRELHWHPNAEEWLYFHKGKGRGTAFIGNGNARTFDFSAGDAAVFPDNSGHYVENTGDEDLVWIELYKSDRVKDISLAQWLALTPPGIVSSVLKIPVEVAESLKKEKQLIVA